jgi:hypothetical protein
VYLKIVNVINYALDYIVSSPIKDRKTIINWLKELRILDYEKGELNNKYFEKEYKYIVLNSNLRLFDKLFILHIIGEKEDYEQLIKPTIELLRSSISEKTKKEIKYVLYEVLE